MPTVLEDDRILRRSCACVAAVAVALGWHKGLGRQCVCVKKRVMEGTPTVEVAPVLLTAERNGAVGDTLFDG